MLYQDGLENYSQLALPGVVGPESIAFDCNGEGPYVSVSDGRILKWQGAKLGWIEFSVSSPQRQDIQHVCDDSTSTGLEPVCGRPLGIKFNPATCDLYIADAYYGLLVVGPEGGVATQLAASAEGVPFRFTNALDIDSKTGVVYFTDSSIYFQRREYLLAIINADKTGRLMKYDPNSKKVTVLLTGLAFPNGVALSKDNSFILVAESFTMRILKFYLVGSEIHGQETFSQLGRFPDNIKRTASGEFWVALNTGRGKIRRLDSTEPQQETAIDWLVDDPVAVRLTSGGKVVRVLDGNGGNALDSVSEVEEYSGLLWLGSSTKPYVGYIKNKK
uniref:Strictosidine synthase conserved region domain-containing protein n=1 Tax=Salix viminalis TaxID=40686 RepID=A0A6N2M356_SALVM